MSKFEEVYTKLRAIVIQEATAPISNPAPVDDATSSPDDSEVKPDAPAAETTETAPEPAEVEPKEETPAQPTKPAAFAMTEITDDAKKADLIAGKVVGLDDGFSSFVVVGTDKNDAIAKFKAAKDTIGYMDGKLQENLNIPVDDKTSVNVYRFYVTM